MLMHRLVLCYNVFVNNNRVIKGVFIIVSVFFALVSCVKKSVTAPSEPAANTPVMTFTVTMTATFTGPAQADLLEPDDSPAQAKLISQGITSHSIYPAMDQDWVKFNVVPPGASVTLETYGVAGGDTTLYLFRSSDTLNPIASDDDGGNALYSKINANLLAGDYYAQVVSSNYDVISQYTLSLLMPGFTATSTATPTFTPSPTRTDTPTVTPTFTITPTYTQTPSWSLLGGSINYASNDSLVIDNGTLYVAYVSTITGKTNVAVYDGASWVPVGLPDFSPEQVSSVSLAVYNGTPYVVYQVTFFGYSNDYELCVMKYDGNNWVKAGSTGCFPDETRAQIAFINGTPYVIYYGEVNFNDLINVIKYDGLNWVSAGTTGFSLGSSVFQCMAKNNLLYVAYTDNLKNNNATVMVYDGINWSALGGAGFTFDGASNISLVVDNSTPYIAYIGGWAGITVMKYNGLSWDIVGNTNFAAATSFMLSVYGGRLFLAYADSYGGSIKVVTFNGVYWESFGQPGPPATAGGSACLQIYNGIMYLKLVQNNSIHIMSSNAGN